VPDYGGKLIDGPGTFLCFAGALVVIVWESSSAELNYTIGRKPSKVGPSKPALSKCTRWAIYPENEDNVWVFNGTNDVTRIEFAEKGGSKFTSSQVVPDLLKQAPKALIER